MRRILLGGLVLALGGSPTLAQSGPPSRGASLGRPLAVHEPAPVDPGVTPASLLARGQGVPVSPATPGNWPVPMPMPAAGQMGTGMPPMGSGPSPMNPSPMNPSPMNPSPMNSSPMNLGLQPMGQPGSAPPMGSVGTPSVTEVRTPAGSPPAGSGGVPTVVPLVGPEGGVMVYPGGEYPLGGVGWPGCPAVDRVGCLDRWYSSAEMLTWWTKSDSVPPLLTTSAPQFFGIPGRGNTTTVLAGEFMNTFGGGGRFTIGRWFGDSQIRAMEARFFFLGRIDSMFTATSDQYPVLARPFFNVNNPVGPFSQIIASPGLAVGGAVVDFQSSVWGAEANYRRFLFGNPCARVDALVGYRYVNIKERLSIAESFIRTGSPGIGAPAAAGLVTDVFRTENAFNGGQIGLAGTLRYGRWSIDGRATVAFGNLEQTAEISGAQQIVLPSGAIMNYSGGLLALPGANIGTHTQNVFAVIPEVGVNVGYQLTSRLRVFVGYNFLYLGNALRPSGAMDLNVDAARIPNFPLPGNPTPLPGVPRPAPQFNTTDYFVQGISFGLQFNW